MSTFSKRRITVFSPFSGIWPHSLSEWQLFKQLRHDSFAISVINCGGVLNSLCPVMEARRLDVNDSERRKEKVCRECSKCAGELRSAPYERQYWLSNHISEEELVQTRIMANSFGLDDFPNLTFEGVPIGFLTAYETLIKYKKTSLDLNETELRHWKSSVFQGLVVQKSARRVLEVEQPDTAIVYSPQYSAGSMFASIATEMGIDTYFIEGSSNIYERYSALRIWSWSEHGLLNPALSYDNLKGEPGVEEVERVKSHFFEIEKGKSFSVYSPRSNKSFNPRSYFGINECQKILLAALSSYDEAFAAYTIGAFPISKYKGKVFSSQFDWIKQTIDWFRKNHDYFIIIRMHPRDFPNKRENITSEQSLVWAKLLNDLPPNVALDHPIDRISLPDYFLHIDAFTTGWSSTALEALYSGVPVITYDSGLPPFPPSIHASGEDIDTYFQNIKRALESFPSAEHRQNAVSWLSFSFCTGTIRVTGRVSDWYKSKLGKTVQFYLRVAERLVPRLIHRIDISNSLKNSFEPDKSRFNEMMMQKLPNLYRLLVNDRDL